LKQSQYTFVTHLILLFAESVRYTRSFSIDGVGSFDGLRHWIFICHLPIYFLCYFLLGNMNL